MLAKLTIKNYALIDELAIDYFPGLNIVTGETGAGKSIILGALSLILGARADSGILRDNNKKCIVEGIFNISTYGLQSFFKENDLDFEVFTILRREIAPSGKSRAFVNDTPTNLKLMSDLGSRLIDIHSQHQNPELTTKRFQLGLTDVVAGNGELLLQYQELFGEYLAGTKLLTELKTNAEKEKSELDYYEFQLKQLDEAGLSDGEQEDLEAELEKLNHAEEIKGILLKVNELLDNEQSSALGLLKEGNSSLGKISNYFKEGSALQERLMSSYLELKDISEEINRQSETIHYDPARLEFVNNRLDSIYSLQQKHHVNSIQELLRLKARFENQISGIVDYDIRISKLEKEIGAMEEQLHYRAIELSKKRRDVFPVIEDKVAATLRQLGMPKSKFRVAWQQLDNLDENGLDSVGFLFSANKDTEPDEISRIASGGETSRLMLAIKSLMAKSKLLPTIIFDEVDSGVSGEIAIKTGDILKEFSNSVQIINITHLPQIAGKGDHHFKVFKYDNKNGTFTSIKELNYSERVEELAKMVGGDNPTENARKTAKELLG